MLHTFHTGCDLLEKSYFCSIANNGSAEKVAEITLWFAWKIVLLQYRKQLNWKNHQNKSCCDLLEKSYFCSIANNKNHQTKPPHLVVICLKNRTFAVSQTTMMARITKVRQLWFAWKIVLLQYRKQLAERSRAPPFVVICLKNRTFAVSQTTWTL